MGKLKSFKSQSTSLPEALKHRHILIGMITLVLIGIVTAALFHWLLVFSLKDSKDQSYWVNLAGKQRMLSQAITVDIYRLYYQQHLLTEHQKTQDPKQLEVIQQRVKENIESFRNNINILTSKAPQNDQLQNLYFHKNLIKDLNQFLINAETYNQDQSKVESFNQVNNTTNELLERLDLAVLFQQELGEQSLKKIYLFKTYIWVVFFIMINIQLWLLLFPLHKRINQLNQLTRKLKEQVGIDPLTGLFNRLYMEQEINNGLLQFQKDQTPFGILALDIDRFKLVNDEHGHYAGDLMLEQLTEQISKILPKNCLFFRSGGEEFVVYMPNYSMQQVFACAEQIRQHIEAYQFNLDGIKLFKTISIGIYHTDICNTNSATQVLIFADSALYHSKNTGRNRSSIYQVNND